MSSNRSRFPELEGARLVLTDGGLETDMIYECGFELPEFASFILLDDERGPAALTRYYERYLALARERGFAILLDTPTWRASASWAVKVGYDAERLASATKRAVELVAEVRRSVPAGQPPVGIGGCLGPRGDAYAATCGMTAEGADHYHRTQIETLAATEVDFVSALTLGTAAEAIGIARACRANVMPVLLSFTLETDGKLPSGRELGSVLEEVDAETDAYAAFYMINCVHPTHLASTLLEGGAWTQRVQGIRANASQKSHAELDASTELDAGDPELLGDKLGELARALPQLRVFGGCCGTSPRHVGEMARAIR